ncbi:tyrosine-protein phosphatase [Rhodococcus sp. UNC363MFTsu5.1]|uniref:tyrosine-protein phosphatase n=1 Tax=Rhodococcus sp. UNC363MFTsu5.1 TaxID=1449069 RepID=UPI0004877C47|nr:tyrosine-protein phosphatase [Rhodococcus sp. UNC363MFTsu5.1]
MSTRSRTLSTRTARAAALLLAGGLLFTAPATAGAFDLSSIDTGSLGGLLDPGSSNPVLAPTPKLASVANFRDVAGNDGAGYATADGKHLKRGVIYRSNALTKTSDADKATLTTLGLADVYDLRGSAEIANPLVGGQDKLPDGVAYKSIPIEFADLVQLAQTIQSPEQGRQFMIDTNRSFVTDPARRAGFAQVLTDIATGDGAQLFHCTSGKDRTGWTAMLLQSIAGVPAATVMDDYLLSNTYLAETNQKTLAQITAAMGAQAAANLTPVLGVDQSFLEAGLAQITADYGSVGNYLTEGLGLSPATIAALKAKLVG